MPLDSRIHEMLSLWEKGRVNGRPPAPEELCRDCPHLVEELRRQIGLLESADRLLDVLSLVKAPLTPPDDPRADDADIQSGSAPREPALEAALDRFEWAWKVSKTGPWPQLNDYLPDRGQPRARELAIELIKLDLKYRLRAGEVAPFVDRYFSLPGLSLTEDEQVELIAIEYQWRLERGDRALTGSEYAHKFPALARRLAERLVAAKASATLPSYPAALIENATPSTLMTADGDKPLEADVANDAADECPPFGEFIGRFTKMDRPIIEPCLPLGPDRLRLAVLARLAPLELEWRLRQGEEIRVEAYLKRFPDLNDNERVVLEMIKIEYFERRACEPALGIDEFRKRFPELADLSAVLDPTPDDQLPAQVGRYRIAKKIGKGGMGLVWRVQDSMFNRPLALKIMKIKYTSSQAAKRRFLREARMTALLQHPCVPPVHAHGRLEDGRLYFVMKLIQGTTLDDLLKNRSSPSEDISRFLAIFEHVCQTVGFAHSKQVIHRDLKPSNIMVGMFGEVQVMDWGLAKVVGRGDRVKVPTEEESTTARLRRLASPDISVEGDVVGTPEYMPPEAATGAESSDIDQRADVFGLGGILCKLLTGLPPFTGKGFREIFGKVQRAELAEAKERLASCGADRELIELALRCLSPGKEDRPANGAAVAAAVAAYRAELARRLREAEVDRAAAEARAEEEIKRRAAEQARADAEQSRRQAEEARADEARKRLDAEQARTVAERRRRWTTLVAAVVVFGASAGAAWLWHDAERQVQRQKELGELRHLAERSWKLAKSEVQGRRYGKAEQILETACRGLRSAGDLVSELASLEDQKDRLGRLDRFYTSADETQRLAYELLLSDALKAAERALDELKIPSDRKWWDELDVLVQGVFNAPEFKGLASQKEQLRVDIHRHQLFLAGLLAIEGSKHLRDMQRARSYFTKSLTWLQRADRYPSSAGNQLTWILQQLQHGAPEKNAARRAIFFARIVADLWRDAPRNLRAAAEEKNAADPLFMGLFHLSLEFIHEDPDVAAAFAPAVAFAGLDVPRLLGTLLPGLDFENPFARAEYHLRGAVAFDPQHYFSHIFLAGALIRTGKLKDAELAVNTAIALRRNYPAAHVCLAEIEVMKWQQTQDEDRKKQVLVRAQTLAEKVNPATSPYPLSNFTRGNLLFIENSMKSAITRFDEAVKEFPRKATFSRNRAACYLHEKQFEDALKNATAAVKLRASTMSSLRLPDKVMGLNRNFRGNIYFAQGKFDEAIRDYEASIRSDPDNSVCYCNLGTALRVKGEWDKAMENAKEAIDRDSQYPAALDLRGLLHRDRRKYNQAIEDFGRALWLDPKDWTILEHRAEAYKLRGAPGDLKLRNDDLQRAKRLRDAASLA